MEKLILKYLGEDFIGIPVYETEDGVLFKDVNLGRGELSLHFASEVDADPDTHISNIKKYKGLEIVLTGQENEPTPEEKFNYQMLGRLKMDCDYFLGNGNRYVPHLWAGDIDGQIEEMKKIHDRFSEDKKPEWLTLEDILKIEKEMKKTA